MLQQVTLGRQGLSVTQLGLGCAPLGDLFERVSEEEATSILQTAWDSGIRYFDTAPLYGHTKSEHRLGAFLRQRDRSEYVLSTKVGRVFEPHGDPLSVNEGPWLEPYPFAYHYDYSYDGIMRSFEDSLHRLGVDRVDALVIHDLDLRFHQNAELHDAYLAQLGASGWRALAELRSTGAVRAVGAGINELGLIERFNQLTELDFVLVANGYNLLSQTMLGEDFASCQANDVQIVIGAVFGSGILASAPTGTAENSQSVGTDESGETETNDRFDYEPASTAILGRLDKIRQVCARHDVPLAAAALQFPMAHPLVAAVIPGATKSPHVEANVQNFERAIPVDLWDELKSEELLHPDAPTSGS